MYRTRVHLSNKILIDPRNPICHLSSQNDRWSNVPNSRAHRRYSNHPNVTAAMHVLPTLDKNYRKYKGSKPSHRDSTQYLIQPVHYDVKIKSLPNLRSILAKEFEFEGEVVIHLYSRETIHHLLLGASELQTDGTPTARKRSTDNPAVSICARARTRTRTRIILVHECKSIRTSTYG